MTSRLFLLLATALLPAVSAAQNFDERFSDWPLRTTIRGTIAIGHRIDRLELIQSLLPDQFASLALIEDAESSDDGADWSFLESATDAGVVRVRDDRELQAWLQAAEHTDGSARVLVWSLNAVESAKRLRRHRSVIADFVDHRNTLILVGPYAAAAAEKYQLPSEPGHWRLGSGLIPDSVCRLETGQSAAGSLGGYLKLQPRHFGIQLQPNCLLVLQGRKFQIAGEATATFSLPAARHLPPRQQVLVPRQSARQDPNEFLIDLTEWRRDAIERTLPRFPAARPEPPHVANGTLMIVGGGRMPTDLMKRFVDLAGGPEKARLVYVPCSESETVRSEHSIVEAWKRMGVRHATFIHTKDRVRANEDAAFYKPLADATGIWFGGGRQWNFADSYYGTTTHRLMKNVLQRGGVIGGSSAGASIQGRYLARATPIQNYRIMAPGYERGGLGFLSGVAIDQHFTQRKRQQDLIRLVETYPQLLGIGIDEGTAILVRKSTAEVVGDGTVSFYDRRGSTESPNDVVLSAGARFDLIQGEVLENKSPAGTAAAEDR